MTIEGRAELTYRVAKARHRLRRAPHRGNPIVVFSMAKTGSSAVAAGLRSVGAGDVYHVHDLDPVFLREEEEQYRWSGRPWRNWDAQQLLSRPPTPSAPWRVVSLVRDPIAQSVSAFFQPGSRRGYLTEDSSLEALQATFGDRLDRLQLRWFETHLLPSIDLDVYAHPFDPHVGYAIISTPVVRLLLLRFEDLEAAPRALAELLDTPDPIHVPRVNVGTEKDYADAYRAFRHALRPSATHLDRAYGSRMVRHFYAPDEIDRFRSLWSADAAVHAPPATADGEAAL